MIFNAIADVLSVIAVKTRLTYKEINIIVYFFVIPFTWLCLLDMILKFHYLKFAFVIFTIGFFVGCRSFRAYSDWLFDKSVSILSYFNKCGLSYITSSVWICVLLPLVVYTVLLSLIFISCF